MASPGSYTMPDDIWFAWSNNQPDTGTGSWVASDEWDDHERIHQYALDSPQTYGGYPLTVDANWLDVGKGSVGTPSKPLCRGVDVDLRRYPTLRAGSRGPGSRPRSASCASSSFMKAKPSGKYDKRTVKAVKKAQRKLDQKQTGKLTRRTWVALLARGKQPLLKVGSTGDPVRRLQRALTAALGKRVNVDGALLQEDRAGGDAATSARQTSGHRRRDGRGLGPAQQRPLDTRQDSQSQVSQTPVGSSSM